MKKEDLITLMVNNDVETLNITQKMITDEKEYRIYTTIELTENEDD